MRFFFGAILAFCWTLASAATAATVDFSEFPEGDHGRFLAFDGGLVVSTGPGSVIVYGPSDPLPGLCAARSSTGCGDDLAVIFFGPVRDLAFALSQPAPPQTVAVSVIDAGGVATTSPTSSSGFQAVTAATPTRRLQFDFPAPVGRVGGGARLQGVAFFPVAALDDDTGSRATPDPETGLADALAPEPARRTLDFSTGAPVDAGQSTLILDGAQVTHLDGRNFFVYDPLEFGMPETGGFCALSPGFICLGDILVTFDTLIENLTFEAFFGKPGDRATANIYAGDTLLGSRSFSQEGIIDFTGYAGISHLEIIDDSDVATKGFAYGNFEYAIYTPPTPVPLPAPLFGLIAGLAALAGFSRTTRTRKNP